MKGSTSVYAPTVPGGPGGPSKFSENKVVTCAPARPVSIRSEARVQRGRRGTKSSVMGPPQKRGDREPGALAPHHLEGTWAAPERERRRGSLSEDRPRSNSESGTGIPPGRIAETGSTSGRA